VEGHSVISADVLGAYAADAAREIAGVNGFAEGPLHRQRGVRVVEEDDAITIEVHLMLDWAASAPEVGLQVQQRIADYLGEMAAVAPRRVDVVIAEIAQPPVA